MSDIQALIDDREAKIAKKQSEIDLLKAEVKALQEAQEVIDGNTPKKKQSSTRDRALTEKWSCVLKYIGEKGQASYDDILLLSRQHGLGISGNALRGQMSIYTNDKGWVERVKDGVFKLTEAGAEKCGYSEHESSSDDKKGGVAAPPNNDSGDTQTNQGSSPWSTGG